MCEPDKARELKEKYGEMVIQRLDITQALARAVMYELDNRTFEEKIPKNAFSTFDPSAPGECPSSASSLQGVIERKLSSRAKMLDIVFDDLVQHTEVPYTQITNTHPFYEFDWEQVELDFKRQKNWISSSRKQFMALKQQLLSRKPVEKPELAIGHSRPMKAKVKRILDVDARLHEPLKSLEGRSRVILPVNKNVEAAFKRTQATRERLDALRERMDNIVFSNSSTSTRGEDRSCLPEAIQRQLKDLDAVHSSSVSMVHQRSLVYLSPEQLTGKISALVSDLIVKNAPSFLQEQLTHFQTSLDILHESAKLNPPIRDLMALEEEQVRLSNCLDQRVDAPAEPIQPFKHALVSDYVPPPPHREEGEYSPNPYRSPSRCPSVISMEDGEIQGTPQAPIRVSNVWGSQLFEQPYEDSDEDMETLRGGSTNPDSDESMDEIDIPILNPSEGERGPNSPRPTAPDSATSPDQLGYPEVPLNAHELADTATYFTQTDNARKDPATTAVSLSPQPLPTEDVDMKDEGHHRRDDAEGLRTPDSPCATADFPHDSGLAADQSTTEQWEYLTVDALLSLKSYTEIETFSETEPSPSIFNDSDAPLEGKGQPADDTDEEEEEAREIFQLVYTSPSSPRNDTGRLSPATPTPRSGAYGSRSPAPLC